MIVMMILLGALKVASQLQLNQLEKISTSLAEQRKYQMQSAKSK